MEKDMTELQTDFESTVKFKYNDVVSWHSLLPTCNFVPDLTQIFPPSFLLFPHVLSPSLCLPPSSFRSCCLCLFLSRNLSYNNLTRLDEGSLAVLVDLHTLRLGHNSISHINEGAFKGLKAVRVL